MKRIFTTTLMLTLFVCCSFAQSIVGTWKSTEETFSKMNLPENSKGSIVINFKQNKTCTMELDITLTEDASGMTMVMHLTGTIPGTYTASNGHVSANFNSASQKYNLDLDFPGLEEAKAKQIKQLMAANLPALKNQMAQQMTPALSRAINDSYTIEGDVLTLGNTSFNRVKTVSTTTNKSTTKNSKRK